MKNSKRVAFITGVTGQDGAYLANLLLEEGYEVYGSYRRGSSLWRLDYFGIKQKVKLVELRLSEPQSITKIVRDIRPNEFYHLAAESFVADSFKYPNMVLEINTHVTCNILEAIRVNSPNTKLFFASSSEIFGISAENRLLNESSECNPMNPYAISKLSADYFIKMYRNKYEIFACSGILFNHESPLRSGHFVSRKITEGVAKLKFGSNVPLNLGDFGSSRDWGSALDYVKAMKLMLTLDTPEDFIIATGKLSSVRDLLKIASLEAGFDPVFEGVGENEVCIDKSTGMKIAIVSKSFFRLFDTPPLSGDASKIKLKLGWKRGVNFEQLISEMMRVDIDRQSRVHLARGNSL